MMIADYNLKALVFDDVEEEAKPLIEALNYERIPNIYINFKDDDRGDAKKVQNIRIVFSDLIVGAYMDGDETKAVEAIRTSILDNISPNNGPFILVAWSKHSSLVTTLQQRILEVEPGLNFVTVELSKNDYFKQNDENKWKLKEGVDFKNIISAIKEQLKDLEHLEIFFEWEQDARNSTSKVLNSFLEKIEDKVNVEKVVSSTIKSTLGEKVSPNSKDKLDAFYHTLNSILADSIDNNVAPDSKHDAFLNTLELEDIDSDMNAIINRKTLFEDCNDKALKTGNIYSFEDFKSRFSEQVIQEICGHDIDSVFNNDFFQHNTEDKVDENDGSIIGRICKSLCRDKGEDELLGKKKFGRECKDFTKENTYPVLMEFTPSCDIANNKYTKSRLIFGYLFDSRIKCIKNKSESLYMTSFHFKYQDSKRSLAGNYRLVFFIKNIFAVNPEKIKQIEPMIRARKEFATDLQHAIANHISRIGISSVDGF